MVYHFISTSASKTSSSLLKFKMQNLNEGIFWSFISFKMFIVPVYRHFKPWHFNKSRNAIMPYFAFSRSEKGMLICMSPRNVM